MNDAEHGARARRTRSRAAATASSSRSSRRARATSRRPRTRSPTRSPRRSRIGRVRGVPAQSRGVAADGRAPQADRLASAVGAAAKAAEPRARSWWPSGSCTPAEAGDDMRIPDQRLALMFACAHPAIEASIRAPLMLQTVLGFDAATIASAFLASPAAMGKRLVRAKAKIRQAGIPLRVPEREELARAAGCGARCDLRRVRRRLAGPGRHRAARRELAEEALYLGPARGGAAARRAGGARPRWR